MPPTKRKRAQPIGPLHRRLTVTSWDSYFSVSVGQAVRSSGSPICRTGTGCSTSWLQEAS